MTWLRESPYGPQRLNSWRCCDCPEHSGEDRHGEQAAVLRAEARAHVEAAGHNAEVRHGTREYLYPVATEAAKAAGCGNPHCGRLTDGTERYCCRACLGTSTGDRAAVVHGPACERRQDIAGGGQS